MHNYGICCANEFKSAGFAAFSVLHFAFKKTDAVSIGLFICTYRFAVNSSMSRT